MSRMNWSSISLLKAIWLSMFVALMSAGQAFAQGEEPSAEVQITEEWVLNRANEGLKHAKTLQASFSVNSIDQSSVSLVIMVTGGVSSMSEVAMVSEFFVKWIVKGMVEQGIDPSFKGSNQAVYAWVRIPAADSPTGKKQVMSLGRSGYNPYTDSVQWLGAK